MKLSYAIKKKFPKSGALKFCVWDEDNKRLFDSEAYADDSYDKRLLQCEVTSLSVSYGPYCGGASMAISIETGARERRELIEAAKKLQAHCEKMTDGGKAACAEKKCPFWQNYCILQADSPIGWDLSDQPGTS